MITKSEAKAICTKVIKKVTNLRFCETTFERAWSILKFEAETGQQIDAYELKSLAQNLVKLLSKQTRGYLSQSATCSEISSAKLHRIVASSELGKSNSKINEIGNRIRCKALA